MNQRLGLAVDSAERVNMILLSFWHNNSFIWSKLGLNITRPVSGALLGSMAASAVMERRTVPAEPAFLKRHLSWPLTNFAYVPSIVERRGHCK